MPLSRTRDYLSIGEVLEALRGDFPDVSISKIRFLESEGLITPERTGSGYRKFYDRDVERLRFVLALQRDHFLPLKVIRERLAEADADGGLLTAPAPPASVAGNGEAPAAAPDLGGVHMSRDELLKASGLTEAQMRNLEDFGLVSSEDTFDELDLIVARSAKRFFEYGVEARHLRMYKLFAEKEAAFIEQIVAPVTRRRDPGAHNEVVTSITELASLSRQMKEAALRVSLRQLPQ